MEQFKLIQNGFLYQLINAEGFDPIGDYIDLEDAKNNLNFKKKY